MSFQQLPSFIISRRMDAILRNTRGIFSPIKLTFRAQSTETNLKLDHDSMSLRNWTKVYPFLPTTKPLIPTNDLLMEYDKNSLKVPIKKVAVEERQTFIEHYLSHELSLDKNKVKTIYFLCENFLNQNYPNNESIIQLCSFLKLFFTPNDLYYNPKPFMIPFNILFNRILILKELGFRTFNTSMIESTQEYLQMTPTTLTQYFDNLGQHNCFDSLCKILEIVGDDKKSLVKYILANYGEVNSLTLSELRTLCVARYLSTLLKISFNKVEQACKRANRNFTELSLHTVKLNVNYLLQDFSYPGNKVIHNGLFASLNPDNLHKFSTKLKTIVDQNTYENFIEYPVILKTDFDQIVDNFQLIKSKCNEKFFTRSMDLLIMPHEKLKTIFEDIESNDDIKQLNLSILGADYLAMNLNKILERIDAIKDEQIPLKYVPLSFFQATDAEFNEFINDVITDPDLRIRFYLEEVLNMDYFKIKQRLKVIPNVNAQKYSLQNAKRITEFLISMNIPKDLIIDSIYLILYDYKQVKSAYFNACSRYDKTLHTDPNFFKHIFDYLLFVQ